MGDYAEDNLEEALREESQPCRYDTGQYPGGTPYNDVAHISAEPLPDMESLEAESRLIDATLNALDAKRRPQVAYLWRSNGKDYRPHEMTTAHLTNAIAQCGRLGKRGPVIDAMRRELASRPHNPN